jgi:hypothetical protein
MHRFENADALAKAFVRAYFTTDVYQVRDLGKFYAPDATIGRGGATLPFDQALKVIPHTLPAESTLTVVRYSHVQAEGGVILSVVGLVEKPAATSPFTQTFVIVEADNRLWIKGDFLMVADDRLFERIDPAAFFTMENPRAAPPRREDRRKEDRARPPPADERGAPPPGETRPRFGRGRDSRPARGRGRGGDSRFFWTSDS